MSRLPPTEKLPLAVRKDIRDNWESKKEELEKRISDTLGVSWSVDIEAKSLYPYAGDGDYAQSSTGSMIASYVESAASRLRDYIEHFGDEAKNEINTAASAHVLTMDLDTEKKFSYCGCEISSSNQLVILFAEGNLGTNIDDALNEANMNKVLQDASTSRSDPLSYETRFDIRTSYNDKIGEVNSKINEILKKEYTIEPHFEDVSAKLKASEDSPSEWHKTLGSFMLQYMSGLASKLEELGFGKDDMLQEAFNEAVESGKIVFRIVDESKMKSPYCETAFENGILYIQANPKSYGVNIDYAAEKIVDQL